MSFYRPNGYTEADQRSDTSFLVGVRYGESVQRTILGKRLEALAKAWDDAYVAEERRSWSEKQDTYNNGGNDAREESATDLRNLIKELTGE